MAGPASGNGKSGKSGVSSLARPGQSPVLCELLRLSGSVLLMMRRTVTANPWLIVEIGFVVSPVMPVLIILVRYTAAQWHARSICFRRMFLIRFTAMIMTCPFSPYSLRLHVSSLRCICCFTSTALHGTCVYSADSDHLRAL